ncbi:hypothetical protein LNP26_27175 [Klebsiella variicola subsp. variicola]|nr:hypothetical protein [Klebsiella variicola subsp. variicola]
MFTRGLDGGRWDVADFGANARTIIESVPNAQAQNFSQWRLFLQITFRLFTTGNGNHVMHGSITVCNDGYGFGLNIEKYILKLVGGASAQSESSFIEGRPV